MYATDAAALDQVKEVFLRSWEARPLRAVEYICLWGAYKAGGLTGSFLVQWLFLTANSFLLFVILRSRLPTGLALLSALVFLLYPADATHAWAASTVAKIGMFFALLAILSFSRNRPVAFAVLATMALLTYEAAFLQLALAPFVAAGSMRSNLRRCLPICGTILIAYAFWRGVLMPTYMPDVRAKIIRDRDLLRMASDYITSFGVAPSSILVRCQSEAFGSLLEWGRSRLLLPVFAVAVIGSTVLPSRYLEVLFRRLGWCPSYTPFAVQPASPPGRRCVLLDGTVATMLSWLALGLLAICSAAALAFWAPPVGALGWTSRFNYFPSLGAAIMVSMGWGLAGAFSRPLLGRKLLLSALVTYLAALLLFRTCIQDQYVSAAKAQARIWQYVSVVYPTPQAGDVLVLDDLPQTPTFPRPLEGTTWETNAAAKVLLGPGVACYASRQVSAVDRDCIRVPGVEMQGNGDGITYPRARMVWVDVGPANPR